MTRAAPILDGRAIAAEVTTRVAEEVAGLIADGITVTHILTRGLPEIARRAEILVVAAGSPGLVRGDWVKPGAIVIDVGINRVQSAGGKSRLVGDVAVDEVARAAWLTPVPAGVGPMTIACPLSNTAKAARAANPSRP